jgi:hypothetical protein
MSEKDIGDKPRHKANGLLSGILVVGLAGAGALWAKHEDYFRPRLLVGQELRDTLVGNEFRPTKGQHCLESYRIFKKTEL